MPAQNACRQPGVRNLVDNTTIGRKLNSQYEARYTKGTYRNYTLSIAATGENLRPGAL